MYYAYSEGVLQMVQAFDLKSEETVLGRRQNPRLAPYWYSVPRWVWAPLPQDPEERDRIVKSAISGDDDVISMPRYFKSWEQGLPALRRELKPVDAVAYFAPAQKKILKERMRAAGFAPDQPIAMPLTGREKTLLAVFDPASAAINAFIKAD